MIHLNDTGEELLCDDIPFTPEQRFAHFDFLTWKYKIDRKAEYDKLNQDEMRFDDLVNGTTTWQDAIIAIKNKYPKPE